MKEHKRERLNDRLGRLSMEELHDRVASLIEETEDPNRYGQSNPAVLARRKALQDVLELINA